MLDRFAAALGKTIVYEVIGVKGLNKTEAEQLFQEILSQGEVFVGGDGDHAVLVIGYDKEDETLMIRDPYKPDQTRKCQSETYASDLLIGEPWITVLKAEPGQIPTTGFGNL